MGGANGFGVGSDSGLALLEVALFELLADILICVCLCMLMAIEKRDIASVEFPQRRVWTRVLFCMCERKVHALMFVVELPYVEEKLGVNGSRGK